MLPTIIAGLFDVVPTVLTFEVSGIPLVVVVLAITVLRKLLRGGRR